MANEAAKRAAARAAANLIEPGTTVGLGSGSTAALFIDALAERVRRENLAFRGVPTSRAAEEQARGLGLTVFPLSRDTRPDLTVDGADEVDPDLHLIKGGGGALMQEKLVAVASRQLVIIADDAKAVPTLGAFPLPAAIVPFGWETTLARLEDAFGVPAARREKNGAPIVTDDGLFLIDLRFGAIPDPAQTERALKSIVGVVESGLFVGLASRVIFGHADGTVEERTRGQS